MGYDFRIQGDRIEASQIEGGAAQDGELEDATTTVHPLHGSEPNRLSIDGRACRASLAAGSSDGEQILEIDGRHERVFVASRGDVSYVHLRGRAFRVEAINALEQARLAASPSGGDELLRAPMPGTVVSVAVEPGQSVDAGQLLLTIESMKLQTAITAPAPARVAEVCVSAGANFDQGDALVRLEGDEPADTKAHEKEAAK